MKNSIRFVTCEQYPQGTPDDRLVLRPLASHRIGGEFSIWNDHRVNWRDGRPVVIRSPWDYWEAKDQFLAWLTSLGESGVRLYNPFPVMKWNFDKIYLSDIEKKGHLITPTVFHTFADAASLLKAVTSAWDEIMHKSPWIQKLIVKPRISANAWKTYVIHEKDLAEASGKSSPALDSGNLSDTGRFQKSILENFATFSPGENLMIQPFLEEVLEQGEWSLFYFWGQWSHTCLKTPAKKDFRVQEEHGGIIREMPAPEVVRTAADAIAAEFAKDLLYARVDLVLDQGRPLLMELEVIEPALYLRMSDVAPENFARALQKIL
ncbi:MAG: hypothetical protein K2X47_07985 [Bdellovibrionales bacterium]|nr:hypothetical protein [Bdellovibrionales bacterium]